MSNLLLLGVGGMAAAAGSDYPVVEGTPVATQVNTSTTIHTVNLPASVAAGEKLIVGFMIASPVITASLPAGWSQVIHTTSAANSLVVFERTAVGGETTVAVTFSAASRIVVTAYRVSNWQNAAVAAGVVGLDPPNVNFAATDKHLVLAFAGSGRSDWTFTAPPSGYSTPVLQIQHASNTATSRLGIGSAWREVDGASENPGVFTESGTMDNPLSVTVALRGV